MIPVDLLIEKGAAYRHAKTDEIIFHERANAAFYYQLVSGRIRWANFNENGREVLHRLVMPGESFGELPLFDNEGYAASAIADTPCTILRLGKSAFTELLHERPDIHFQFTRLFAMRLRFNFFLMKAQAKNSPGELLGDLIEYFKSTGEHICQECNKLLLTRQQLANISGLRVETVIRSLKNLEKDDKLNIIKGKVFVPPDRS